MKLAFFVWVVVHIKKSSSCSVLDEKMQMRKGGKRITSYCFWKRGVSLLNMSKSTICFPLTYYFALFFMLTHYAALILVYCLYIASKIVFHRF